MDPKFIASDIRAKNLRFGKEGTMFKVKNGDNASKGNEGNYKNNKTKDKRRGKSTRVMDD